MKNIIAIMALLIFPMTEARADESWYGSVGVDVGILSDAEVNDPTGVLAALATEAVYDPGFGFSGALGYRWNKFRLEGELAYNVNDIDQLELLGVGLSGNGDADSLAFMLNGWRDFSLTGPWSVNAGGGIGFATVSLNDISVLGVPLADDSDTVFAYQLGVGLGYAITRNAVLTVDYRFFGTTEPDFTDVSGASFSSEYYLHRIGVGVRLNF